ncbi:MAG: AtpZ/AtpI family protein [Thermoanaerobaculia bacterium]|nr:AtpZ/AtpI family protein [Thermoanaerobaculia bacterium]
MLKRVIERSDMSLAGLGFDLAASVAVATALGWWIDHRWGTEPWGIIVCAAIGIVGGLVNFVRAGQKAMARRTERERPQGVEGDTTPRRDESGTGSRTGTGG